MKHDLIALRLFLLHIRHDALCHLQHETSRLRNPLLFIVGNALKETIFIYARQDGRHPLLEKLKMRALEGHD